uniref:Uncharacterized protein n=1 Tax=Amphimedon queenslandica TaxID=400682 RepID=A0A1X7U5Q2_AMPQE
MSVAEYMSRLRCGQSRHAPNKCLYKTATCFNVIKLDVSVPFAVATQDVLPLHARAITRRPIVLYYTSDTTATRDEYSFTVRTGRMDPIIVDILMHDVSVKMEQDTGSSVSTMSLDTFRSHFPFKVLEESSTLLRTYSGELLTVQGIVHVNVVYKKQAVALPLYIVSEQGPTLFGREWLFEMKLDWYEVHSIKGRESIDLLLDKFESLFTKELGQLKDFKGHIYFDSQVTPKFYKPRPIPYTYKKKV